MRLWKENISSTTGTDSSASAPGYFATGLIPVNPNSKVYLGNLTCSNEDGNTFPAEYTAIVTYDSNKTKLGFSLMQYFGPDNDAVVVSGANSVTQINLENLVCYYDEEKADLRNENIALSKRVCLEVRY